MEIKHMMAGDTAEIARLEKICFQTPWSKRSIAHELETDYSLWLVAHSEQKIVGYVGSQISFESADVMNIAVDPAFRRQGIARQLLQRLLDELAAKQVHSLTLEVRASNAPACGLYDSMGFTQVGRRKNYYQAPREDALILKREW